MREILTWVQGRMGLVALHDRVQTTTTTLDGKTITANKVQRHGCYQPSPMGNTAYGHSIKKMHVFQPLPPEKCTFFSHFHLKNARFSATST
jgi:hypothetical protein